MQPGREAAAASLARVLHTGSVPLALTFFASSSMEIVCQADEGVFECPIAALHDVTLLKMS